MNTPAIRNRIVPVLACLATVAWCLGYAKYRGELSPWWQGHGGGVPYVLFWILLWFVAFPKPEYNLRICIGCVLFTCFLEFGQLWKPQPLAEFRSTKLGAALLGSGFVWADMPPYFLGGILGNFVIRMIVVATTALSASPAESPD